MRKRNTIIKIVNSKLIKIKQLEHEINELRKEGLLLSDKKQHFTEIEEKILICGRPKKYVTKLIGRIHWKEDFIDEDDGTVMSIDRSRVVRVNCEWV